MRKRFNAHEHAPSLCHAAPARTSTVTKNKKSGQDKRTLPDS